MRITKSFLRSAKSSLLMRQAKLCAILASEGKDGLWKEHQRRFPHYDGERPEKTEDLLRQLLWDDVDKVLPSRLTD